MARRFAPNRTVHSFFLGIEPPHQAIVKTENDRIARLDRADIARRRPPPQQILTVKHRLALGLETTGVVIPPVSGIGLNLIFPAHLILYPLARSMDLSSSLMRRAARPRHPLELLRKYRTTLCALSDP